MVGTQAAGHCRWSWNGLPPQASIGMFRCSAPASQDSAKKAGIIATRRASEGRLKEDVASDASRFLAYASGSDDAMKSSTSGQNTRKKP